MTAFKEAVSVFGVNLASKLSPGAVIGEPEEQLRFPVEHFLTDASSALGFGVAIQGEVHSEDAASRFDFAVMVSGALCGVVELKALGKGAKPGRYRGHDKKQADRLLLLPNVIFTDAEEWTLFQNGEQVASARFTADIASAGSSLADHGPLEQLLNRFLMWEPQAPTSASELAAASARLCRLLRESVSDRLEEDDAALKKTAEDWRHLLFPDATDSQFADGYAQAVSFGLLIARATGVDLTLPISAIAQTLGHEQSLIGRALFVLADAAGNDRSITTTIDAMRIVFGAVDWTKLEAKSGGAWLYFYEHFLEKYDPVLRKETGSYYTPPAVVTAMTQLVDEALAGLVGLSSGIADDHVVILDPAMGTGTFLVESINQIAARLATDYGSAAAGASLVERMSRLIGFELQLGPFAVAQLRIVAELHTTGAPVQASALRTYVADTLSNPFQEQELLGGLGQLYEPIAASRREADRVKREEKVLVVLGNPPYKDKAKGRGGWVESGSSPTTTLFRDYLPPEEWGVSAHARHLYNAYVYFWRWAEWKVFEQTEADTPGVICFITAAAWVDGDGFQQMRRHLRQAATDIFVIHCTPEGHQPPTNTRIFPKVQHELAIVLAVRRGGGGAPPAKVRVRTLASASQQDKFSELLSIRLDDGGWTEASDLLRAPFVARPADNRQEHPRLADLFIYNGSGVMLGRSWPVAPDRQTLSKRQQIFFTAKSPEEKANLLLEHRNRRITKKIRDGLPGFHDRPALAEDTSFEEPRRYAARSLDRQWIIPDKRLINEANPNLWGADDTRQLFLTAPNVELPGVGPASTVSAYVPDVHHYAGRGGRVYPLFRGSTDEINIPPRVLASISNALGRPVGGEELFAYIVGVTSSPTFSDRFVRAWGMTDWRVPITRRLELFERFVRLGRRSIALQTYGERGDVTIYDVSSNAIPRMAAERRPLLIQSVQPGDFPDKLTWDAATEELRFGTGIVANVTHEMRTYSVDDVVVLDKWFSYRRKDRSKPDMGRRVSPLDGVQPTGWLASYTEDLIDLLNVIGLLLELHREQAPAVLDLADGPYVEGLSGNQWVMPAAASGHAGTIPSRPVHPTAVELWSDELSDSVDPS